MHHEHSRKQSLQQKIHEFAKTSNGELVLTAALAVADTIGLTKDEAKSSVMKAAIQSLSQPVVVSVYADLPESTIEMLAEGNYSEFLRITGGTSGTTFDPKAIKYNAVALLAVLIPMVQPVLDRNPTAIGLAAAGLAAGLAALKDQWKQEVTGDDAEIILILKNMTAFRNTRTVSKLALLNEINSSRNIRGTSAFSETHFENSLQRLLTYRFVDYDNAAENVTLKS
jgi:hypothetical protein